MAGAALGFFFFVLARHPTVYLFICCFCCGETGKGCFATDSLTHSSSILYDVLRLIRLLGGDGAAGPLLSRSSDGVWQLKRVPQRVRFFGNRKE